MQNTANSGRFECTVWVHRGRGFRIREIAPAPRKPGGFGELKTGQFAYADKKLLTLSVAGITREVATSQVEGFTRELLTARQQRIVKVLDSLIGGALIGLILGVVWFFTDAPGFVFLPSLGLVLVLMLPFLIPTLLRARTVDLFTLKFRDGRQWDFGVSEQQAENVVRILRSLRIKDEAM